MMSLILGILLLMVYGGPIITDGSSDTCSHHLSYIYEYNKLCSYVKHHKWDNLINSMVYLMSKDLQAYSDNHVENLQWIFYELLNSPDYFPRTCSKKHGIDTESPVPIFGKRSYNKRDDGHSHNHHNHDWFHHHHSTSAPTTKASLDHHSLFGHHDSNTHNSFDLTWWQDLDCTHELLAFYRETIPTSVVETYQKQYPWSLPWGPHSVNGLVTTTKPTTEATTKATETSTEKTTSQTTIKTTTLKPQESTTLSTATTVKQTTPTTPVATTPNTPKPTTVTETTRPTTTTNKLTTPTASKVTTQTTMKPVGLVTPPDSGILVPHHPIHKTTGPPTQHTPTPATAPAISCAVCSGIDECFGRATSATCSSGQYCLSHVTDTSSGYRNIEKRCASKDECYKKWWLGTSDRNVCFSVDDGLTFIDLDCTFCCKTDSCNSGGNVIPTQLAQFTTH